MCLHACNDDVMESCSNDGPQFDVGSLESYGLCHSIPAQFSFSKPFCMNYPGVTPAKNMERCPENMSFGLLTSCNTEGNIVRKSSTYSPFHVLNPVFRELVSVLDASNDWVTTENVCSYLLESTVTAHERCNTSNEGGNRHSGGYCVCCNAEKSKRRKTLGCLLP